jgi:hypothetical protein
MGKERITAEVYADILSDFSDKECDDSSQTSSSVQFYSAHRCSYFERHSLKHHQTIFQWPITGLKCHIQICDKYKNVFAQFSIFSACILEQFSIVTYAPFQKCIKMVSDTIFFSRHETGPHTLCP